jgi:hypothetical protein
MVYMHTLFHKTASYDQVCHKAQINALGIQFNRKLDKYGKSLEAKIYDSSIGRRIVTIHKYYRRNVFNKRVQYRSQ